ASTHSDVLPSQKMTSGNPQRCGRCKSTCAKPRSATAAASSRAKAASTSSWPARTSSSRLRRWCLSITSSVAMARLKCAVTLAVSRSHDVRRARDGYRLWFQHHFNAAIAFLVEQAIRLGRLVKREAVRDEERRVDLVLANAFQQWPHEAVHMGLTHLE